MAAKGAINDTLRTELDADLLQHFRPEFINRLDSIVYFTALQRDQIEHIVRLQVQQVVARLAEREIALQVSDAACAQLAEVGFSPEFGARPIKRAVQQYVVNPVATFLLQHPSTKEVAVDWDKNWLIS